MHSIHRLLLVVLLLLIGISSAGASVANAPGANLEVSLITYGPGETYWERFGHDAIEVRDSVSGESVDFNYGVFDFNESNFFINFARGRMHYLMDAEYSAPEQASYMQDGRSVTRQHLALPPQQATALRDYLLWNMRPENAGYAYDYYADNCTTRVRDALDKILGGALRKQLTALPGGMTYRQQTARLMNAQPWLMLVLDLGLGPYADQPLNAWQESFLPMVLQQQLNHVQIDNGSGGLKPLVQSEQLVSPNRLDVPPVNPPDLRLPLAAAGLILAACMLAARRWSPIGYALLTSTYLVAAGLVGLLLIGLWTLTTHHSAWANANLLFFNPLALIMLPAIWRARRGIAPSRFIEALWLLQLLAILIALSLHLLPGVVQQNQPWLLFAMPCWLAIAWSLRRGARPLSS
ncbi:hypothetical protein HDE76_003921 [Rhodanobacter sp. ANJX3]|uniref:lipoprotein N-acyltransferase Lnb domain-containing protein n=1 Tax=Rhodanobacter sp. ANJX3 TaxID=2723083 RepID=UPI0016086A37|nr:DUF4105 domain-containing protein [Rhodanobacter sp. ANJX3]MBB5360675.1 hypothetical protein [Rhodanobacter sp. ANJX3]